MKKLSLLSMLSATAVLSISASVYADSPPLTEIVVTAKGNQEIDDVLSTAHIIDALDIENAQVKDLPALLDRINGITVTNSGGRGSQTSVFVRGVAQSQTIVLIDGVRVGSATLGAAALNSFPIEAIERIEVVKGPLSGIYGADAVGGVIQLFTKKGGEGLGSARVSLGSDSLYEYGLTMNGGNDKVSFRISADAEDTDGIDNTTLTANGADDDDSFEEKAVSLAGQAKFTENTSANLSILYADSEVEFDDLFGGVSAGLLTQNTVLNSAFNLTTKVNDSLTWVTTLGINKDESVTPEPSSYPSDITTNRDVLGTELQIQTNSKTTATVGIDYYQEDIETLSDFPVTDRDNKGVYGQLKSDLGKIGFVTSLRFDDNSAYGSDTNGSIAINYDINDAVRAVASYGTAFVAPSFNSLYFPFFGNPDLLPEESESLEISLHGNHDNMNWRVSAYHTDIENLFSFDPATFLAANVGEAEIKGLEFEIDAQLADWQLAVNFDLLSAEDKDTGIELDGRAERTMQVSANRDFDKLNLRFDVKFEDGRFDNRGTELSGHGLFDISASYQVNDDIKLLANFDNLFDKDYTVNLIGTSNSYNTEGRQAKITLLYNF